jgi:hypothetical protein
MAQQGWQSWRATGTAASAFYNFCVYQAPSVCDSIATAKVCSLMDKRTNKAPGSERSEPCSADTTLSREDNQSGTLGDPLPQHYDCGWGALRFPHNPVAGKIAINNTAIVSGENSGNPPDWTMYQPRTLLVLEASTARTQGSLHAGPHQPFIINHQQHRSLQRNDRDTHMCCCLDQPLGHTSVARGTNNSKI